MALETIPFDIRSVLDDLRYLMAARASSKGLDLVLSVNLWTSGWLIGDPTRLRQVLTNLVGNAIKFTEQGGVCLLVDQTGVSEESLDLRFEIRDTGIGIDESQMAEIFEPFCQADSTITRRFGGTGLGLSLSRKLVRLLGGEIVVQSTPGRGSSFFFEVSFGIAHNSPQEDAASKQSFEETESPDPADAQPLLVAEDNRVNQMVARRILEKLGFEVDIAGNGLEAVEAAQGKEYSAILMDLQMPVMDGLEAIRTIRASSGLSSKAPIIALTANASQRDREECFSAGADDFVSKPIDRRLLGRTLRHWISRKGRVLETAR